MAFSRNGRSFAHVAAILLFLSVPRFADADRLSSCDAHVIDIGFSESEVVARCGEPTTVHRATITRYVSQNEQTGGPRSDFPTQFGIQSGVLVSVDVEKWFYNFGRHRLTRTLTFEDGELVRIETGHYGY